MPEFALSKFVPLPDISPVQKSAAENNDFQLNCRDICSVDTIESFPSELHCCKRSGAETVELMRNGDASFRAGYFREAVLSYTQVLQKFGGCCPSLSATCFAKRSATFAMMSCELCVRPVSACALYGMDASRLAHLALKDAEKITEMFPQQSEGYLRSAFAYYLSEQYQEALEACLEGFRWNFTSRQLQGCMTMVERQLVDGVAKGSSDNKKPLHPPTEVEKRCDMEDFECKLCLQLLYEPVTTPCGHSFCSSCIQRSLDHSNKCPMCRRVMHVSHTLPVTVTLKNIISRLFREEYERRELEMTAAVSPNDDQTCTLPLFVLFTLFPGEKMSLNVFEPRYRLMIRRVMEGSRSFGMIQSCCQSETGLCPFGTECEIIECEPLADGRYFLEVIGRRRFKVMNLSEQDGYRVVRAQYVHDRPVDPVSDEMTSMKQHMEMIERLVKTYRARGLFHRQSGLRWNTMDTHEGGDMEEMSFMACALLVNPDGSSARRRYLDTRSTLQRMEWILQGIPHP